MSAPATGLAAGALQGSLGVTTIEPGGTAGTLSDGDTVFSGRILEYTATFDNTAGTAAEAVDHVEDLRDVLNDATVDKASLTASAGLTTAWGDGDQFLQITGTVPKGKKLTVALRVTLGEYQGLERSVVNNFLLPTSDFGCAAGATGCKPGPIAASCAKADQGCTSNTVIFVSMIGSAILDLNNDGFWDDNEPQVVGAGIRVTGKDLDGNPVDFSRTTDSDGAWAIVGLKPSDKDCYTVVTTPPAKVSAAADTRKVCVADATERTLVRVGLGAPQLEIVLASDPQMPGSVEGGGVVGYSITLTNKGKAEAVVDLRDYIADKLDDADLVADSVRVSGGVTTRLRSDGDIGLGGRIAAGATATVTYQMKVKTDEQREADGGDDKLIGYIAAPGEKPTECHPDETLCTALDVGTPAMTLTRKAEITCLSGQLTGMDMAYKIENTGTLPLHDVALDEPIKLQAAPTCEWPDPQAPGVLEPGETATCSAAADVTVNSSLVGQTVGTATAVAPLGGQVSARRGFTIVNSETGEETVVSEAAISGPLGVCEAPSEGPFETAGGNPDDPVPTGRTGGTATTATSGAAATGTKPVLPATGEASGFELAGVLACAGVAVGCLAAATRRRRPDPHAA
jgi:hypothetical protein